jgi:hypothetical protein
MLFGYEMETCSTNCIDFSYKSNNNWLIGILFGYPKLVSVAILLEILFFSLAILIYEGYSKTLYL